MVFIQNFVSAILGGIAVALGSVAYLALFEQSVFAASFLFALGFLMVAIFDLALFTDRVGFLFQKGHIEENVKKLFITLFGNAIGAWIIGFAFMSKYTAAAKVIFRPKLDYSPVSVLVGALVCGALIYVAIHGYRRAGGGMASCLILTVSASIIPLCNLEYAVSNLFYMGAALHKFSLYTSNAFDILFLILLSAAGNALGAMIFSMLYKFKSEDYLENRKHKHHHHHHHSHSESEDNQ